MHTLISIFYFVLLAILIYKWKFFRIEGFKKGILIGIFALKVLFGILLWMIYNTHYEYRDTSDAFKYYEDSKVLHTVFKEDPQLCFYLLRGGLPYDFQSNKMYHKMKYWHKPPGFKLVNDNRTLIRLNFIFQIFSRGYYHVHTIFMCFLSLIGLTALYKIFKQYSNSKWPIFIACFLLPSLLLWGSGILKEGLLLFGLGLMLYFFHHFFILNHKTIRNTIGLLLTLVLLFFIKLYVLFAILPSLLFIVWWQLGAKKHIMIKFFVVHFALAFMVLNLHHVFSDYNVLEILALQQQDFINLCQMHNAGSYIEIPRINSQQPFLLLRDAPRAIFNTLFRPHLLEVKSAFYLFNALENFAYTILCLFPFFFFRMPKKETRPYVLVLFSFVIILSTLIGFTTPALGAIVRYKIPLLPFFTVLIFCFISKEKALRRIPLLNRFLN